MSHNQQTQDEELNIEVKNQDGYTALHWAVKAYDVPKIKFLIECGADICTQDHFGNTLLHTAISSHFARVRGKKLEKSYLNITTIESDPPIENLMNDLLDLGMNLDVQNSQGKTPLSLAIELKLFNIAHLLIEKGADLYQKDNDGNTLLHLAAKSGSLDLLSKILDLIDLPLDITNHHRETPIQFADKGHYADIERLEKIKLLIQKGFKICNTQNKNNDLQHAIQSQNFRNIRLLLQYQNELDINAQNEDGDTALHLAIKHFQIIANLNEFHNILNIFAMLFLRGADPTIKNYKGETAAETIRSSNINMLTKKDLIKWGGIYNSKHLYAKIEDLKTFGENLKLKGLSDDGDELIASAERLKDMASEFFEKTRKDFAFSFENPSNIFNPFQDRFLAELNCLEQKINRYPLTWKTIFANIVIALTGIGILFIALQLMYSYHTQNKPLFFFQTKQAPSIMTEMRTLFQEHHENEPDAKFLRYFTQS